MHRVDTKAPIKLALCIPSAGTWCADFGYSLAAMCVQIAVEPFENDQERKVVVLEKRTSTLPRSRQELLEDALLHNCTHALFLDSDQAFPNDTAHRLIAHKKPLVAANIALKTIPSFPTARQRGPTPFGIPVTSGPGAQGLEKVWRVGTGIMLIDLAILRGLPKPWFELRWSDKASQFVGEDWYFLGKLEKNGFSEFYIDHDLSRQIGHVGNFMFTHTNIPKIEMEQAA